MKNIYDGSPAIEPDSSVAAIEQESFLYLGDVSVGIEWVQAINWCHVTPDGRPIIIIATDAEDFQVPVSRLTCESVRLAFMKHFPAATTALLIALERFDEGEGDLSEATFLNLFLAAMEEVVKAPSLEQKEAL